jgi:hypothetical protein
MKDIFSEEVANELIQRIRKLQPTAKPLWGKMSADQVLAHCNVTYAFTFESDQFERPGAIKKFLMKAFIKPMVVGDRPYPKSSRTAPEFIIQGTCDFEMEKERLIGHIQKVQQLGFVYFDGKDNFSFGEMSGSEWNALFYKHLDHHLRQFGV